MKGRSVQQSGPRKYRTILRVSNEFCRSRSAVDLFSLLPIRFYFLTYTHPSQHHLTQPFARSPSRSPHLIFSQQTSSNLAPKMSKTAQTDGRVASRTSNYAKFWQKEAADDGEADVQNRLDSYEDVVNGSSSSLRACSLSPFEGRHSISSGCTWRL